MEIRLSTSDGVPVYRQIVNQVKYLIASGRLRAGQEMPTIRALAERLLINPNTVVHAYAELEKEGVIVCRHGSGTFVAESVSRQPGRDGVQALAARVDSLLVDAAHLNLGLGPLLQLIAQRHRLLKKNQNTSNGIDHA
ncbi:MAG TPA: GntR family transcriptional regulator [Candidatus Paceibacterota bacterium]|nr:GntR family transcriptional regulator [Verrucomicrobiota bacterium]HRY50987.1 GntR family transcriptional regulator [Candidatus Paceibacterota bacterium]HSA02735.1 GntR family transcriptional regulator [Candidatus Paceibacterota bacterium]